MLEDLKTGPQWRVTLADVRAVVPTSLGGKDGYDNWQLLHRHCHDTKTAGQRLSARQG